MADDIRTHCYHGHELTPENTRLQKHRNGLYRRCIRCSYDYNNEYRRLRRRAEGLDESDVPSAVCDCGEAKDESADACARCLWLDGDGRTGRIISAFRSLGYHATLDALAGETCDTERTVYRALADLRDQGRLDAFVPVDGHDSGSNGFIEEVVYVLRDARRTA